MSIDIEKPTQPPAGPPPEDARRIIAAERRKGLPGWVKRLIACLAAGVVLAMMVGKQQGSKNDFGVAFHKAVLNPRIVVFLAIGVLLFFAVTYWPKVKPFIGRPGVWPLASGTLAVVASYTLLNWLDGIADGKFGPLGDLVSETPAVSAVTSAYFGWLAWALVVVALVAIGVTIVTGFRPAAWAGVVLAVIGAVLSYVCHSDVVDVSGNDDHSLGFGVAIIGYLIMVMAGVIVAQTKEQHAQSKRFVNAVLGWRPGAALVVLGLVVGFIALVRAVWFSPSNLNSRFGDLSDVFDGQGVKQYTDAYFGWAAYVLFVVLVVVAAAACFLRRSVLGWVAAVLGLIGTVYTLFVMHDYSDVASKVRTGGSKLGFDGATGPWQNLGTGGWMACGGFFLVGAAGLVVATRRRTGDEVVVDEKGRERVIESSDKGGFLTAQGATKTMLLIAVAAALFYPPTATAQWQSVLVTQIGVYVLLAIGLNVVVGWAGLLDLGFIAFYAIGSYTTAYFTGSLPVDPPSWLQFSPLVAIPFAIVICLIAGVLLGAPTLRLRGDYLAIVTLGFGEIIYTAANQADGITGGPQGTNTDPELGTHPIPPPVLDLGFHRFEWGVSSGSAILQYWYLLLVLIVIVVLAFRRLEHSRIGRAWAATREDEVAAEASGVNTFRIKLLAFAVGASTSGIAGVFYGSQIGYISPESFTFIYSTLIVAYVVFGGAGSLPGAIAGAATLTWLPVFLEDQVPESDKQMWVGAVLLATMIFRPQGLIPAKRRAAELEAHESSPDTAGAVPAAGAVGSTP
ncbi:branched-chain amino acid ABC transporter permease [Jatrophihabitans fulvus]